MNFKSFKLSNVVPRLLVTICLLTIVLSETSGKETKPPVPPEFFNFTNRIIESDSCVDSIKLVGEGKFSQVCLGDTAKDNYACNPLDNW